jgi:hypothetical protein
MIVVDADNRFEAWLGSPPASAVSGEERRQDTRGNEQP